jgi:hypothetical protein
MNEEARKLWKTPLGGSILSKWMTGETLNEEEQQHVQKLKKVEPSTPKDDKPSPP